jgi:CubicO group peptidase (beta-lactamase class C family)
MHERRSSLHHPGRSTRKLKTLCILAFLLLHVRVGVAQSHYVDSCVAAQMNVRHIPGLALGVIKDGVPVKVKGYGLANVEHSVPVNPQTIFQSGSVGKQFTAMLTMLLAEQGRIGLDDPIPTYFPNSPENWQGITIRHLLTHTSGIANYTDDTSGISWRQDYSEDQLVEKAKAMPVEFQPGEKWSYSNTGYVLLGILLHKAGGKFYGDLLREHIFAPLSMETARIINETEIIPHRAAGYQLQDGEWKNQAWVSPTLNTTADGSLYLSILDLVKWEAALSTGRILSKSGYDNIWSPIRLPADSLHPYGFGWSLAPIKGRRAVHHSGGWQGFNAYIVRYVDDRLTVILLANLSSANPGKIAQHIAGMYIPELAPTTFREVPDKEPAFTARVALLFSKPDTSDLQIFTTEYRKDAEALLQANLRVLRVFGKVLSVVPVAQDPKEEIKSLRYRVRYKAGSHIVTVGRTISGQISSITLETE